MQHVRGVKIYRTLQLAEEERIRGKATRIIMFLLLLRMQKGKEECPYPGLVKQQSLSLKE